ncbi:MSMEG_1061 family FMN-dependent PPOX-type flavoprotein [Telluribacter sp. SYSU D00476]|uniref:MSMEG_1061 family FMN-dependent PPOX-type flavoprotein n=1 Tax=Telluribacter sp. SYSU D00476 TaxID=2811430 RepID=UPI001FF229FD|nr:MSMEG_1061 family FMN-dependent PPOX-type flavoprotein [Telluribacter sp. SYSU D00476]
MQTENGSKWNNSHKVAGSLTILDLVVITLFLKKISQDNLELMEKDMKADKFEDVIASREELHSLLGVPSETVRNKVIHFIDKHCQEFISKSPMLFVATSDSSGHCDVSPRGDKAGFVLVLDEKRLVIPERPGNKRFDTLGNIIDNPQVGLIFIIPGLEETLRINGRAKVIKDKGIMELLESNGNIPTVGIGIDVEECYIHCAKSFKRSLLWDPFNWLEKDLLPKPASILAAHIKDPKLTEAQIAMGLKESYEKRLY